MAGRPFTFQRCAKLRSILARCFDCRRLLRGDLGIAAFGHLLHASDCSTGTRRNQAANDDVLFETTQPIGFAVNGSFQHAGGPWKEAAEMNERFWRDALVIPCSTG